MKTKYRILHHGGRSWLQFESSKGWRYIRDEATSEKDCPKHLPSFISQYFVLNFMDDSFCKEVWVTNYPNINDYFEKNRNRIIAKKEYEKQITYL